MTRSPADLSPASHAYKRVGDLELIADVYVPPHADGTDSHPVVLWIHGGALVLGTRKDILRTRSHELELYLDEGWVVISIDYRLAPENQAPEIWEDVRDALTWAREQGSLLFGVDGTRVAAVGPSSGGYLSLLAGALAEPRPTCVVSWFGYGDMTGDWYTTPDRSYQGPQVSEESAMASVGSHAVADLPDDHERRQFYDYARQHGLRARLIGGEKVREYSPEFLVTKDFPPTLLIHGDADTAVPVEQSVQMAEALAAASVEHEHRGPRGTPFLRSSGGGRDRTAGDPAIDRILEEAVPAALVPGMTVPQGVCMHRTDMPDLEVSILPPLHVGVPALEIAALAADAEAAGVDGFWYADERFYRDTYSVLALCAQATTRIRLGPGVTDPYTRHPAITAAALATLDEISGGRAVLGIAAGVSGFRNLGIDASHPAVAVREGLEVIRRLLAGETVNYRGQSFSLTDGRLLFASASVPAYVAAEGPWMLRLAGAVADAVIIYHSPTQQTLGPKLALVDAGAERGGRGRPRVVARLDVCVSTDAERAVNHAKLRVARYLWLAIPWFLTWKPTI